MINWQNIKSEATDLLRRLVQINTSNPPGNEKEAIEFLSKIAKDNEFHVQVIETAPNRANLMISYNGTYRNPLILLSHVDVVPANGEDWEYDPFAGQVVDDVLYGRGTIDTKQLTIMQLMVMILLKRNNVVLKDDLVMIATADEESGSELGLLKVLEQYGYLFENSYVISEGGGFPIVVNHIPHYLCEVGQKGICRLKFHFPKKSGSNPYFPDNESIYASADLVSQLNAMHWEEPLPITTQQLIRELLTSVGYSNQALTCTVEEQLKLLENSLSPFLFTLLKAMTKTTFTVTRWKGGRFHDGIGTAAEVEVDGRVLPGITKQDVRERIEKLVKNSNIEWEITAFSEGYESSFDSPLFKRIQEKMEEEISNCKTVPFISTGSSDGRFLRTFDSKVYGFSPMLPDMSFEKVLPMVHGINERIPLESLVFGIKVLYDVIYKSVTEEE